MAPASSHLTLLPTIASPVIGADYNSISTLVSFSGGDGPLTLSQPPIQITIIDDSIVERTETFDLITGVITINGTLAQFINNNTDMASAQIIDNDGMFTTLCPHDMVVGVV